LRVQSKFTFCDLIAISVFYCLIHQMIFIAVEYKNDKMREIVC
jgi:hypothetical protein